MYNNVLLVNGTDGSTIWTLGGEYNDFEDLSDGRALGFTRQHHERFSEGNRIMTLFDNAEPGLSVGCTANCSRGLCIKLDYEDMTAEVVGEYFHPASLRVYAQGSLVALGGDNALIGWGAQPGITEHRREGGVVMDVQVGRITTGEYDPENVDVYRAYKMDWTGRPGWAPNMAVEGGIAYLSWNGATEVRGWSVVSFRCRRRGGGSGG